MAEQARAKFDIDAAGGVGEDITAHAGEHHFEQDHDQQAHGHDVERGETAMDQHLVHDDLEKQRRHQREKLQDEGHQQHFAEQLAVLDHGGNEPGEVELGQLAGQRGARGEQDQLIVPARGEIDGGEHLRAFDARIVDQHLVANDSGEDKKTAFRIDGQGGQRRLRQAGQIGAYPARLEAELPGGEQDLRHAEVLARFAEVVGQLVGVGGNIVEPRQHDQADEAGVRLTANFHPSPSRRMHAELPPVPAGFNFRGRRRSYWKPPSLAECSAICNCQK
ncbi:MAG: hypothetical protein Q8O52_01605 [Sulfuritalea sp.]|nr:hypothetical protein [Sulfuritalea sp.]